jgi:hypothetical protein
MKTKTLAWTSASLLILSMAAALPGLAQDAGQSGPPPASNGGWRKFQPQPGSQPGDQPAPDAAPVEEAGAPEPQGPQQGPPPPSRYAPTTVSLPAGTWVTVRLIEPLSSDHNIAGDPFTGTLLEPIVINGLLLARRGARVGGVVSEAKKAGRVSGVSHLGFELTEIQLADGRQVQVKTQLMQHQGDTSHGRDAAAIGTTTAVGAAIGAGVDGGFGAGIGAAAGLVASVIGVMVTRGHPSEVYPETPLTFRMQTPLTLDNSQQTFLYASQQDYNAPVARPAPPRPPAYGAYGPRPYYYGGYYPPAYGYPYPYPYFYGPSLYFGYSGYGGHWGHHH